MTTTAELPPPGSEVLQVLGSGEESAVVTFVWPQGPRTGICAVPWKKGCSVRNYLHSQPLRQYPLLGIWHRCHRFNAKRQRVKLLYVPEPGDTIVLSLARRIS